ncbi:peptidase [Klebsiella pneumoniae]|uniref:Peptidase n=1 Tax=Klebsiella pneumoniae TaxID=573 RepID=A0A3S4IJH2_KLEPN|nr:peptidase [Klebsiella pneumoniae]
MTVKIGYQDDEGIVIREISKFSRLFDVSPVTYPHIRRPTPASDR